MGTRGNIFIKNKGEHLVTIYTQYDAYPEGLGVQIWEALNKGKVDILNGFGSNSACPKNFNGIDCFAAYLIGQLKGDKIGNVYIASNKKRDPSYIDYSYIIDCDENNNLSFEVWNFDNKIFNGDLQGFGELVEKVPA